MQKPEDFELTESFESSDDFDLDEADFETQGLTSRAYKKQSGYSVSHLLARHLPWHLRDRFLKPPRRRSRRKSKAPIALPSRRRLLRRSCHVCFILVSATVLLVALVSIFAPSYTSPPAHYGSLKSKGLGSDENGRANPNNEKVFIAASLYDPDGVLVSGAWGNAISELIMLLGVENVFLSIYENDGDVASQKAMKEFEKQISSKHTLNYEKHMPLDNLPRVKTPEGTERIKRIAYLAETRNKALAPLDTEHNQIYDKILFLNDIIFNPIDAAQLLFSTNMDGHGRARYNAACALDFINPFKFYDTFATRDFEGYSMGVPFFPWFTGAGHGVSRWDVLEGKDAVKVKSCWGGMVAFDGKYFQQKLLPKQRRYKDNEPWHLDEPSGPKPLRFRSSQDPGRESSECCLIHADLARLQNDFSLDNDTGIYVNPFVRVAYSERTLSWIPFVRRFERLFTLLHSVVDWIAGMPRLNPLRFQQEEDEVGGFCSIKGLQVMRENAKPGEKNWETLEVP